MFTETEDNPIPLEMRVGTIAAEDNGQIRYAIVDTKLSPRRGTIICLHGRNECIEKYFETANDLTQKGFTFVTFDWRGQGGSTRLTKDASRGYVRSFAQYRDDLNRILQEIVLPECSGPYFILAHSTGSLVALSAAHQLINRISRMVLLTPFLGMNNQLLSTRGIAFLSMIMRLIGLGKAYMAGGPRPREAKPFAENIVTSDRQRYARNTTLFAKAPHLFLGGPTASWVNAATRTMAKVTSEHYLAKLHIPILMLTAGRDKIVDNSVTTQIATMMPCAKVIDIHGASHELLQEKDYYREQVLAAIYAFLPGEDTVVPQKTALD